MQTTPADAATESASSSRERGGRAVGLLAVGLLVAEHGEQDVAAAAGQADECGVVFVSCPGPVLRSCDGVGAQRGESGQEQGSFEVLVPGAGWELVSDAGVGASGDRRQAGAGGEVSAVRNWEASLTSRRIRTAVLTPKPGIEVRTSARG